MAQYAKIYCKLHFCQLIIINMENEGNHTDIIHRCAMYIIVKSCKRCARSCGWNNNVVLHLSSATCMRHRLLPERAILRSKRFQFLLVPAHGAAAIHRNTGPPDQSVEPRSRSRTIAYPSDSKVRSVYTGIWTSLMTVITLGSTLQLHVSSGSCASVILRSGVTHHGGQDRVLLAFSVDLRPRIFFQFHSIHLFIVRLEIRTPTLFEWNSLYWTGSISIY